MSTTATATPASTTPATPNEAYELVFGDTKLVDERRTAYEKEKKAIERLIKNRCNGKSPAHAEIVTRHLTDYYEEKLRDLERQYTTARDFRDEQLHALARKVEHKPLGKPLRSLAKTSVKSWVDFTPDVAQQYARAELEPFKQLLIKLGYDAKVVSAGAETYTLHADCYSFMFDAAKRLHRNYVEDFKAIKALETGVNLKLLYPSVDWENPSFADFLK